MKRMILSACILILLPSRGTPATYLVRPDGTGDYPTIREAIDASVDGDAIELTDGTFTGEGNRDLDYEGRSITIRSQSGDPLACIIDCEREGRGFLGFLPGSLEGVTVTRGETTSFGGAIMVYQGQFTVRRCIFFDNHASGNGGAVFIDLCSRVTFTQCTFASNVGGPGGAICT